MILVLMSVHTHSGNKIKSYVAVISFVTKYLDGTHFWLLSPINHHCNDDSASVMSCQHWLILPGAQKLILSVI